jgi:NAD(P)-dependent dehydrogenase (short-subunit alcohol dehydrogenase family)
LNKVTLFDVSEKIVIITGASGQLGMEYQTAFLEHGAKVIGVDISKSGGISKLEKNYDKDYLFINCDITSKDSLILCLNEIKESIGIPNILLNNAALDSPPGSSMEETGPFENYPEESWDKVLDVNLKGTFLACQVFGAEMAKNKNGSIINISSIYGLVSPDQSIYDFRRKEGEDFYKPVAYSASKSGVLNLTRYLASYWAKDNVRVNSLTIAGVFNNQEDEFLKAYCKRIPIGRMANSEEYNGAVIFLASDASSYMTGSNLILDGGWTAI